MLTRLGRTARARALAANPWTNVYGLARTLLALGTLGTLLFSSAATLFSGATETLGSPLCAGAARVSLFCLAPPAWAEGARWAAVLLLAVVASGWRPRLTGVLHWWIAFSVMTTVNVIDGGDQVTSILTLLLVPVTLLDGRRWHWEAAPPRPPAGWEEAARLAALSCLVMIRLQVAGVYFHAAVGKFRVTEWADGTAVYYWFTHPAYGMAEWLRALAMPLLLHGTLVTLLTWGPLVVELLLFMGIVMEKRRWKYLLWAGLALHAGIAVAHGLVSFALAMFGALVLYLRPSEEEFRFLLPRRAPASPARSAAVPVREERPALAAT